MSSGGDDRAIAATNWATLRALLVARYDELYRRLRQRLGSGDLARETLHETYLRLSEADKAAMVQKPEAYLFGIALNVAAMRKRSEARWASALEIEEAIYTVDESVRADQAVEGRLDIEILERAIEELPARRRAIFIAARVHELPIRTIAENFGISSRLVERELKKALEHCAARLGRQEVSRVRSATGQTITLKGSGEADGEV